MSSFRNLSVVFCYADREEEVSYGYMSQIQSRTEKIVGHRRKPARTGSVAPGRVSSGGGEATGGGGGVAAPPPAFPSAAVPRPSRASNGLPNNQSSKNSGSQQGGQSRMNPSKSNSNSDKAVLNGVCNIVSSQGGECAPFLQFGTINPAMVKGMQVPARTCSAPPNLDEQKSDQVRHDSLKAAPAQATLSASKPLPPQPVPQQKQQTKQVVSQAEIREAHSSAHAKRDTILAPMSTAPTTIPARTSVLPVGGIPLHHLPFQQPLVPVQFSGPNIPMQPHGIVPASFQMTMALPSGNVSQVPQSMFVPSIQSHPMLPQAIMHHGQNFAFAPPLGHQFSPHLNNMVHSITPQFPQQQQPEKLIPQRRAVKITHPDTHEELKLDKRTVSLANSGTSGHRQLQSAASQSSSFPSFNHQISYPTAYNHSPGFFPSPSVPLTSTQMSTGPQAAIYNYPVGQNGQPISFPGSSHFDAAFGGRPGPLPPSHGLLAHNSEGSSFSVPLGHPAQLLVKPAGLLPSEKTGTTSVRISMPAAKKESSKLIKLPGDVPVAPQQKDMDVGYQNTGLAQKQNCEPLVTDSLPSENDKNCSAPSSSTHGDGSEALFSVSAPVSDASMAVVAEKNSENEEALIVTESVHNHQKMLCEMELKQSQPQADTVEPSISSDSADSPSSATNLPSIDGESRISELDKKKDTVGVSDSFRSSLEKEPSQDTGSGVSDAVEASDGGRSFVETCQLQASTSSNTVFDGISRTSESSPDSCETSEAGDEHESSSGAERVSDEELVTESSEKKKDTVGVSDSFRSSLEKEPSQDTGSGVSDAVEASDGGRSFVETCQLQASTSSNTVFDGISRTSESSPDSCETSEAGDEHESSSGAERVSDEELVTESSEKKAFVLSGTDNSHFASPEEGELSDPTLNKCEILCSEDAAAREPCMLLSDMAAAPSISPEIYEKPEIKSAELCNGAQTPVLSRVLLERNRSRNKKKKKKKKEIYSKADAAGCSDPYSAYKPTKEKLEADSFLETIESSSTAKSNRDSAKDSNSVVIAIDQKDQSKSESVDCEVAVDTSTPKLRASENGVPEHLEKKIQTYSKDFLLSFSERCKDLPCGFEVGSELISIMSLSTGMKRGNGNDSIASFGRDRSSGPARGDRRMAAISDDRWNKSSALRMDHSHENSSTNYRPAQGVNNGVLRNPSMHSTNHPSSGVLPGPMHSLSSQGGMGRNNSDPDRWQRPSGIQRGIMPPPQGPVQVFHKSANRYVIGRESDAEEKKQRRLKAILNKLTPQNFDKLLDQVKEVNIDNTVTLNGVISQIFDKALTEPTFCEMYADFCLHLATALPDFVEENEKITFRRLLLNKCQEEFERGEREQAEADRADEEGEIQQTEDEREEKRIRARRRMLGNIRFIGELYKKKMLTDRIMHECMKTLLGQYQNPDEENIEALCKLMSTIGAMIDHIEAKKHMDAYFDRITMLSTNQKLSSRLRFMLKDTIDLRKNKWRQRRKVEGPKKIEDVHRDAAQERQAQTSKVGRGPTVPSRRGPPVDYSHRGSTVLNSTSSQMSGGIRSLEGNVRGSSRQDSRLDERHHFENRMLSVPLPHRPSNDGSVTLGPQGGLAKGMSGRGQGLISNIPSAEISRRVGNSHRMASGSNGFGSTSTDRMPSITREESMPKYGASRSLGEANDHTSFQGTRGSHFADRAPDRPSIATSGRISGSSCDKISASSEPKAVSEGALREKSLSAIREFYSAKDEKEIVQCIRDLNTPGFYPSMVSLWVTDSFEMKNVERSLLAQLLVNLTKGHDGLIKRAQLIQGFESVLLTLEDAVNDAPKAGEFLGHIFGRVVAENVIQLMEIGRLIHEGGEAPGTLVEAGLGSDILGSLLEFVQAEKGDLFLNDIRLSSKLRLDDFKPPNPSSNSKKLNAFL
ncbi:Eukaryotic translation initiation factor 4G [Platanthera zijinensis]|uniref:Eukaryotic translation initiation factor 4G n=1 Tax=Platanthera zijinensis TaxID=2320716 RepID=A0AAP0BP04_9ASPA